MLKDIKKQENEQFKRTEIVQRNITSEKFEANNISERSHGAIITPRVNSELHGASFCFKYSGCLKNGTRSERIKQAKSNLEKETYKIQKTTYNERLSENIKKRVEQLDVAQHYISGRAYKKFSRRHLEKYQTISNPPTIIKDFFALDESNLTERQIEWSKNVLTAQDLTKPTEPVYKPKNRLKKWQYIFYNHLIACKETLLYYIVPLILNIVLLIYNFFDISFFENVVVSFAAFSVFFLLLSFYKLRINVLYKLITTLVLSFVLFIGVWLFLQFNPGFASKIYSPFIIKAFILYFCLFYFLKVFVIFWLSYKQDVQADFGNVVKVKSGAPGVGKTSQGVHEAHILALLKWQKLQYDFFLWHGREKEILKRNNKEELLKYHEIKTSYYFYANRPGCIPCLWSNIEITDLKGRKNHVIELGHLHGVDRLPLYSVVFFDEIGAVLKNEFSLKKGEFYDVSDMFRLGRQFIDWSVICCEQDPSNIYIDCRRVVGVNEYISGQTAVCKPLLMTCLMSLLHFLIKIKLDKKVKRRPLLSKVMYKLDKYYSKLGFRKQVFTAGGNLQTNVITDKKSGDNTTLSNSYYRVRYLPSNTGVIYNQDEYKKLYSCFFDKEIKGKLAGTIPLIDFVLGKGRDLVSETCLLDEKREIVDKLIKKLS